MEKMGSSRLAARGQVTVAAAVRDRIGLTEGDIIDWAMVTAKELCSRPPNEMYLVAIPSRPRPISLQSMRELEEAAEHAKVGTALGITDLLDEVTVKQRQNS